MIEKAYPQMRGFSTTLVFETIIQDVKPWESSMRNLATILTFVDAIVRDEKHFKPSNNILATMTVFETTIQDGYS